MSSRGHDYVAHGCLFRLEATSPHDEHLLAHAFLDMRARPHTALSRATILRLDRRSLTGCDWGITADGVPVQPVYGSDPTMSLLAEVRRLAVLSVPPDGAAHAAAVERSGSGVALAGASGAGKSTLAVALLRHGWGYLSDDLAIVSDPAGGRESTVKPFWVPIRVRGGDSAAELGLPSPRSSQLLPASTQGRLSPMVPLRAMVFPGYEPEASTALNRLTPARALELLAKSSPVRGPYARRNFRVLARTAGLVPAWTLAYGDMTEAVALLANLVDNLPSVSR